MLAPEYRKTVSIFNIKNAYNKSPKIANNVTAFPNIFFASPFFPCPSLIEIIVPAPTPMNIEKAIINITI